MIVAGAQNKGFEKNLNDEVTLVENDLYSAKSKPQIDPSGEFDCIVTISYYMYVTLIT